MKKFTRDQVARKLGIQAYIMDAWEKQFEIEPHLKNGKKIYTRKHLSQFNAIKELLYEKGLALDAAKKYFKDHTTFEETTLLAASPLHFNTNHKAHPSKLLGELLVPPASQKKNDDDHLQVVRDKLISVRERLLKISTTL